MTYSAYLFDLYGTLVDIHTEPKTPSAWRNLAFFYTQNGACWSSADIQRAYWSELSDMVRKHPDPFYEPDLSLVLKKLFTVCGVRPSLDQIRSAAWILRKGTTTHLRAYAGAHDLLRSLRSKGLVILLSNAQSLFTLPELDLLGFSGCFDALYISSDFGKKKPDPSFFRAPLSDFSLDPSRCLMIGNDPVCDIRGATAVGMDSFYIRSALSPKEQKEHVLPTFFLSGMDLKRVQKMLL